MNDSEFARELGLFESLSKVFAAALGCLYLLGFLVVASYLSRFGVSGFDVLHLQYLIAGVWLLGPPVLLVSLYGVERRFSERATPEIQGKFNWRRFGVSSLLSGVPSSMFLVLLATVPSVSDNLTWGMGIRLYLFYFGIWSLTYLLWMARRATAANEKWWLNRSHAAPFYLSALFVLVIFYALWFSVRIYPLIPFSLGGGKPLTVAFFEGEKKMPDEIQKAIPSAKRSVPYKLLLATDKYFIVVSPSDKERALQISRESVAGIVVLTAN